MNCRNAGAIGLGVTLLIGAGYGVKRAYDSFSYSNIEGSVDSSRYKVHDGRRLLENVLLEDRVFIRIDRES